MAESINDLSKSFLHDKKSALALVIETVACKTHTSSFYEILIWSNLNAKVIILFFFQARSQLSEIQYVLVRFNSIFDSVPVLI